LGVAVEVSSDALSLFGLYVVAAAVLAQAAYDWRRARVAKGWAALGVVKDYCLSLGTVLGLASLNASDTSVIGTIVIGVVVIVGVSGLLVAMYHARGA